MEAMTIETIRAWLETALALLVFAGSLPFGVWLRRWLVRAADAAGVRAQEGQLARLDWALMQAVAAAEEWARGRLARGVEHTSGADKMDIAVDMLRRIATDLVRDRSDTDLERLIEARLAQDRGILAPAAGTATARGVAAIKPL